MKEGGGNWSPANTDLLCLEILALAIDPEKPDTLYAGTHIGVFEMQQSDLKYRAYLSLLLRGQ